MADNKKFYWLKLNKDFFKRHDIRIIEEMENGKDYILFYLKLLLESVNHEGHLRFSETIPYDEKMLSVITNTNIDIVRSAMKVLIGLNMVEILDDSTIYMSEVLKITGSESAGARRLKEYRENKKLLQDCTNVQKCNTDETKCNTEIEKEIDIELDIEIEKEKKDKPSKPTRHKYGLYNNVLLSDEELEKLKVEFPTDYEARIDRLSEYIESKGAKYKNHLATIRAWDRRDREKKQPEQPKEQQADNVFLNLLKGGAFDE